MIEARHGLSAAVLLGCLASLTTAGPARAEVRRDFPCRGCLTQIPSGAGAPRGLVVVLHGDEGSPANVFAIWSRVAASAGVVLLAPSCPRDEGCEGSWWRWRGDPAWVLKQADAVAAATPVDPARRYLAGWSGGATYITMFAARWSPPFAALSLAGGGLPPYRGAECAPCREAVHYLQGDRNPYFDLAEGAHQHFIACAHPLSWELLRGADHARELSTYRDPARIRSILTWMEEHAAACAVPSVPVAPGATPDVPGPAPSIPSSPAVTASPLLPRAAPPRPAAAGHCACDVAREATSAYTGIGALALLAAIAARRSAGRRRRDQSATPRYEIARRCTSVPSE